VPDVAARSGQAGDVASAVEEEAGLRARLRECVATRRLAEGVLMPIEGGLSNRAWRLEADREAWFVRRGHPDAERLGVDRRSECVLLHAVAAAGLAPEVLACDPQAGLLVTRFIAAPPWQVADTLDEHNLRRIGRQLRCLHELPVPAGIQSVAYSRQARHLASGLPADDAAAAALAGRAAAAFGRIEGRRFEPALCHNDLHHLNLLDDGERLWLVDWEYGGRGDPLLDVAGFLALHDLAPGPTAVFLAAYGRLGPADRAVLEDARWAFDYVQWLWYRSRFTGPASGAGHYAERLAQRLLRCNN
jgi:thiamine kinase-like enzyme